MNKQKGISQIVVMVVMLILAIALPITTKLVQKSQENRSKAASGCYYHTFSMSVNLYTPVAVNETKMGYQIDTDTSVNYYYLRGSKIYSETNVDPKSYTCKGSSGSSDTTGGWVLTSSLSTATTPIDCNSSPNRACVGTVNNCTLIEGGKVISGTNCTGTSSPVCCEVPTSTQTTCSSKGGTCTASYSGMTSGVTCSASSAGTNGGVTDTSLYCGNGQVCCVPKTTSSLINCNSSPNRACVGNVNTCTVGEGGKVISGTNCTGTSSPVCCEVPTETNPSVSYIGSAYTNSSSCSAKGGFCGDFATTPTTGATCAVTGKIGSGIIYTGLCGGDTTVKCCAPPTAGTDKACTDKNGICRVWETSVVGGSCNNGTGKIEKGLCMSQPTNTSYRCCVPNQTAPAPTGCGGNDLNCPDHQICNSSNACVPSYGGYPCSRDTQCLSTMKCISGKCTTPVSPTTVPTIKPTTVPTTKPTAVPTIKPTATQTPVCTSGSKECVSASAYRVCTNGFWGAATSCGAATPLCTGSGICQAKTAAEATVTVKMAFAGVKPGNDQCVTNIWPVVFRIVNESGTNVLSTELRGIPQKTGSVNSAGEIIYTLSTTVNDVPDNGVSKLALFMKGPKHISMKYGINNQSSWYQSYVGQLSLAVGANSYDFSNFSLLAGDVTGETTGVPDGKIDARDFSFIKEKSQPITEGTVGVDLIGDIDGNCQVNSGDVKLIKESLVEQNGQIY